MGACAEVVNTADRHQCTDVLRRRDWVCERNCKVWKQGTARRTGPAPRCPRPREEPGMVQQDGTSGKKSGSALTVLAVFSFALVGMFQGQRRIDLAVMSARDR